MEQPIVFDIHGRRRHFAGRFLLGVVSFSFCSPHRRSAWTETTSLIGKSLGRTGEMNVFSIMSKLVLDILCGRL
jgi:hypothetical protein